MAAKPTLSKGRQITCTTQTAEMVLHRWLRDNSATSLLECGFCSVTLPQQCSPAHHLVSCQPPGHCPSPRGRADRQTVCAHELQDVSAGSEHSKVQNNISNLEIRHRNSFNMLFLEGVEVTSRKYSAASTNRAAPAVLSRAQGTDWASCCSLPQGKCSECIAEPCGKCTPSVLLPSLSLQLSAEVERALPAPTAPSPLAPVRCWCWNVCLNQLHLPHCHSVFLLPWDDFWTQVSEHRSGIHGLRTGSRHWIFLGGAAVLSLKESKQVFALTTERMSRHIFVMSLDVTAAFSPCRASAVWPLSQLKAQNMLGAN